MKFARTDLPRLRWSLILLGAAILIGSGAVAGSYVLRQAAEKQFKTATNQRAESKAQLASAAAEEQELREKITRFHALQKRGFIGTENRLDWIEQLSQIRSERQLLEFQYEFEPQRTADSQLLPTGAMAGTHRFLVTPQRIKTKLLHEGDLLGFLDDLRQRVRAYLVIRECRLERLPAEPVQRGPAPQLSAECRIDWITLQAST
jgi:hypothetical protein